MIHENPTRQPANISSVPGSSSTRQPAKLLQLAAFLLILVSISGMACSGMRTQTPSQAPEAQETLCPAPSDVPADSCQLSDETASESGTATPALVAVLPTATPRPVRVIKTAPIVEVTGNEEYHLNNCAGTEEMRRPFSDAAQMRTEVTISDQATRSDGAMIQVSEPIRSQLVHEVELAYQQELELAQAAWAQSEMVAGAYTRFYVIVTWEDRVFAASVSFPSDGMTTTVAYTYTQHVPIMGYFQPMPCTP